MNNNNPWENDIDRIISSLNNPSDNSNENKPTGFEVESLNESLGPEITNYSINDEEKK